MLELWEGVELRTAKMGQLATSLSGRCWFTFGIQICSQSKHGHLLPYVM